jgi:hypothetical protein
MMEPTQLAMPVNKRPPWERRRPLVIGVCYRCRGPISRSFVAHELIAGQQRMIHSFCRDKHFEQNKAAPPWSKGATFDGESTEQ